MTSYRTQHHNTRCVVKEGIKRRPFLWFEPSGETTTTAAAPSVELGLTLKPGTTLEQASHIASLLNEHAEGLSALLTDPPSR